jgi:lysozyme family protein
MKDNFSRCLTYVLKSEGGYVKNLKDKGGPTNFGITQHVYDDWLASHHLDSQDVARISGVEVEAIYLNNYWIPIHGDLLPVGIDYAAFDYAVNSGDLWAEKEVQHAVRDLQAAADVVIDGVIGPKTLAAIGKCDPKALIDDLCNDRLIFLRHLKNYPTFGKGWDARVERVRATAKGMVA